MARPISEVMDGIRTAVNTNNRDTVAQSIDKAQEEITRMIPAGDPLGRGATGYPLEYEKTFQKFAPGSAAPLSPGLVSGRLPGYSATGQIKLEDDPKTGLPAGFQNGNIADPAASGAEAPTPEQIQAENKAKEAEDAAAEGAKASKQKATSN